MLRVADFYVQSVDASLAQLCFEREKHVYCRAERAKHGVRTKRSIHTLPIEACDAEHLRLNFFLSGTTIGLYIASENVLTPSHLYPYTFTSFFLYGVTSQIMHFFVT